MFPLGLRARGRDGPDVVLRVDLGPLRPADLTGSRRREHEELEGERHHGRSPRRLHRADGRRHVAMGQRPHVLDQILLRAQDRPDAVTGVVGSQVHRHGPFHHRADAFAHPPRRRRADMPDGPQRLDHVGARHLGDRQLTHAREREPRHARHPILAVLRIAPAGLHLGPDLLGGGGEGRRALETALLGERVATGAGELAVGEGERAGLLERDEREAAEPEFAAASADGDPLDPTPAAGRLDVEVQALAVAIPAGRGDGADEGGREGVFGLARGGGESAASFPPIFPPLCGGT